MPVVKKYAPGTPSYVDLGTPDLDGATAFYSAVFGWEVEDLGAAAGGYRIARIGGHSVAGLGPQMNPGPPFWNQYITVDSVDDTAAAITSAGGTVIAPPMDVMDAGRMAVFMDSTGAACSIWQAGTSIGGELANEPGAFSWAEMITDQMDAATTFYGTVFGWTTSTMTMSDGNDYTLWMNGERMIGGMLLKDENFPAAMPNAWSVYFGVDGTDAAVDKAVSLGATVVAPAFDVDPGRIAVLRDPQGAVFSIITFNDPGEDPNVG